MLLLLLLFLFLFLLLLFYSRDAVSCAGLCVYLTDTRKLLFPARRIVAQEKTQKTILCTWLTEMYLEQLANASAASGIASIDADEYHAIIKDFETFLKTYESSLDRATTFHLISSHGRMDELLFYSELIKDYERVVGHHMQKGDYEAALNVLSQKEVGFVTTSVPLCSLLQSCSSRRSWRVDTSYRVCPHSPSLPSCGGGGGCLECARWRACACCLLSLYRCRWNKRRSCSTSCPLCSCSTCPSRR